MRRAASPNAHLGRLHLGVLADVCARGAGLGGGSDDHWGGCLAAVRGAAGASLAAVAHERAALHFNLVGAGGGGGGAAGFLFLAVAGEVGFALALEVVRVVLLGGRGVSG